MNLKDKPFFDHHTHLLYSNITTLNKKEFILRFLHGFQDLGPWDRSVDSHFSYGYASDWQIENISNLGIIKVVINYLADYLDCDVSIDEVLEKRNLLVNGDIWKLKEYTKSLYNDENIIGTILDSNDPWEDQKSMVFPCPVFRLYNYEEDYYRLLPTVNSFNELITELYQSIKKALTVGFVALKSHIAENYSMSVQNIGEKEAESNLALIKRGRDIEAEKKVFFAMFRQIMIIAQELNVPIHIHAGTTGFFRPSAFFVPNLDPFLFVPFLVSDDKFLKTKVIFLHQGYPYTRHAGVMAYSFPNIFVDTSWVLPWNALGFRTNVEDLIGVCPHDKIFFGSGQHGIPEIAWVAAKVAKVTLGDILEDQIRVGLISFKQAEKISSQLLYQNAKEMYKLQI